MRIFWIILIVIFGILFFLLGQANKKAYKDCVKEGIMSNDTCYQLAYM